MTKRFLIILMMVFWCNVSFAEALQISKCFKERDENLYNMAKMYMENENMSDSLKKGFEKIVEKGGWIDKSEFYNRSFYLVDFNKNIITHVIEPSELRLSMNKTLDDLARKDGDSESMIASNQRQRNENYNKVWELDFVSKELIIGKIFAYKTGSAHVLEYENDNTIVRSELRIDLKTGGAKEILWPEGTYGISKKKFEELLLRPVSKEEFKIGFEKQTTSYQCEKSQSSESGDQMASSGSGFFINKKGYLVTNNHVIAECKGKSKITFKEKEVETELIAKDKTLDLAILRAKVEPKNFLEFSSKRPEKLQKVIVAGYPFGKGLSDDLKFTQGIISSLKGFEDNSNELQIDAAINSGNSGGPIVNEDGKLVAVAVSGLSKDKSEGINFGVKASSVMNFLDVNTIKYSYSKSSTFSLNNKELNKLLEESTVYTFCN